MHIYGVPVGVDFRDSLERIGGYLWHQFLRFVAMLFSHTKLIFVLCY